MSAAYVSNLVINAGTDFDQVFTLENTSTNDVLNLTSYTVSSQMRKHASSSNYVSFASTVINGALGQIRIGLTTAITSTFSAGLYEFVNPDDVLIAAATEPISPGLPCDFINALDTDLNRNCNIDLDGGSY